MNPQEIERAREAVKIQQQILEELRVVKEYFLEIRKMVITIREEIRNPEKLRPLRKTE